MAYFWRPRGYPIEKDPKIDPKNWSREPPIEKDPKIDIKISIPYTYYTLYIPSIDGQINKKSQNEPPK